jgi:hypothetical protein
MQRIPPTIEVTWKKGKYAGEVVHTLWLDNIRLGSLDHVSAVVKGDHPDLYKVFCGQSNNNIRYLGTAKGKTEAIKALYDHLKTLLPVKIKEDERGLP